MPAWPSRVMKSTSGFISRLRAKFCSRLRGDAPDAVLRMRVVGQRLELGGLAGNVCDDCRKFGSPSTNRNSLTSICELNGPLTRYRCGCPASRIPCLAVLVPEIGRQFAHAGVEQVGVLEHLVVEVILRLQPERAGP